MKNFDLVIFDIDGTLLDTENLIYQTYAYTINHHNLPRKSKEEITGSPLVIHETYKRLFPNIDFNIEELMLTHRGFMLKNLHLATAFTHVIDTLETLKTSRINITAITNRTRYTLYKTLEFTKIDGFFDKIITPEDVQKGKPDPEGVALLINEFNTTKAKTIMVGDSHIDIKTGKNAGITTIGVTYGFHGKAIKDHKPDYLVDDIKDILPIIIS